MRDTPGDAGEDADAILIAGLRAGDRRAERDFWERYGAALEGVAARRLSPRLLTRVGPEDIAQSVCRTFLRRARGGEFVLEDAGQLWRLLCAIALAKTREQARFHQRQRRSIDAEQHLDAAPYDAGPLTQRVEADEAALVADALENVLEGFEPEARALVVLKMDDRTNADIAVELGCSERTVRRLLERVRVELSQALFAA